MPRHHGWWGALRLMGERNALRRDVLIKRALGLTEPEYWARAAGLLRLPAHQRS
jgi:hypothetical protein